MSGLPVPSTFNTRRVNWYRFRWVKSKFSRCWIALLATILSLYALRLYHYDLRQYSDLSSWADLSDENPTEADNAAPTNPPEDDQHFRLGSTSKAEYKAELEQFATRAFPGWLRKRAHASIKLYLSDSESDIAALPPIPHHIYQTAKREPYTTDQLFRSWRNVPNYSYKFFDDSKADKWVRTTFGRSQIEVVWDKLGAGIKRPDFLRYLLVMVEGGIYSDIDTIRLKPISKWGQGADFIGPELSNIPSIVVGIEADVGARADWHKFWARELQILQWTFGAAPLHPILIDAVRRVHHNTARMATKIADNPTNRTRAREVAGERLSGSEGISIMEWTGPAVFTDSVLRYLATKYDTTWQRLKGLRRPLRIGDVVVLPMTGFSPGVGLFGAGDTLDNEAMVHHLFAGSWKKGPKRK